MLREFSNTGKSRCGSSGTAAAVSQPATRFFAAAFAPLVFCKEFHSNCARSSGTRGGNRGDAERSRGSRAAPSPWPRPGSPGMDLWPCPGVRWLRCCRSHGWGGSSRAGPPSPCVRHGASSPAQLLVEPRGGTSPTSPRRFPTSWRSESTAPSLRVSGMSEPSLCAGQLCLSSPHKFLGIGWRAKIWHPATQKPSTEIRFREFVGIWVTPGSLQNTPGARGGSIWLRAHSGFSPGLCLQVVLGVRAMRESTEGH